MTAREVFSTRSMRGARSRKRCRRGSNQPLAKAASVVTVSRPSARLARKRGGGLTQQVEAGGQFGKIVAALVGEHEAARQALEQGGVQILLEAAHLLAHGRGRDAQLGGRGHEAAQARGGFEGAQGIEWRQASGISGQE